MSLIKKSLIFLLAGLVTVCAYTQTPNLTTDLPYVDITWMSNANWLIETADVRILLDGWITRIPRPGRPDLRKPETLTMEPVVPDKAGIQRIFEAIEGEKKIDTIISGHSHFDHSFDTAVWARLTGAKVMGPRSTCLQAMAQGIPKSQCAIVRGGEDIELGGGLSVRVVRWHHSGDPSDPLRLLLQTPMELVDVPAPDPETGGLRPGILEDFPVGHCLGFLFTLHHPEHPVTWFWTNSGNPDTFRENKIADEAFLKEYGITLNNLEITPLEKSVEEYLMEALAAEKLDHVNLWLGYGNSIHVGQVAAVLKPRAFIPHHWGGLWTSFFDGLQYGYSNENLTSLLAKEGINLYTQNQYMDKFRLDAKGITPIPNDAVKKKLDFQE